MLPLMVERSTSPRVEPRLGTTPHFAPPTPHNAERGTSVRPLTLPAPCRITASGSGLLGTKDSVKMHPLTGSFEDWIESGRHRANTVTFAWQIIFMNSLLKPRTGRLRWR